MTWHIVLALALGFMVGVFLMCVVAINRDDDDDWREQQ